MFGISFGELLIIGAIALMVVGPDKLPKMLATLGRWMTKLRRITTEVRNQTGIDDLLRQEGLKGGLNELRELRGLVRGGIGGVGASALLGAATTPSSRPSAATAKHNAPVQGPVTDPFKGVPHDRSREYPPEGCDSYSALPDDLWPEPVEPPPPSREEAAPAQPSP